MSSDRVSHFLLLHLQDQEHHYPHSVYRVQHVDERIEAFLKEFLNTVRNLSNEELLSLKDTLTSMKQTVDLTLREEVDRNWGEITDGEYLFDRLQRQVWTAGSCCCQ